MVRKIYRAIFLDRDGVIVKPKVKNRKSYAPIAFKDFKIYKNIKKKILLLKKLGFKIIVITNQPDVENKKISLKLINKMHRYLSKNLFLDGIYTCVHSQDSNCECRKPKIGLFLKAANSKKILLKKSYMIGDRKSDIDAGIRAGCSSIFVDRNYLETKPKNQIFTAKNFNMAANFIIKNEY